MIESCIAVCLIIAFLSIVCSAIQEAIAKETRMRGRCLLDGLQNLLRTPGQADALCARVLRHPLVASLAVDGDVFKNPPSAIHGTVFADALIHELASTSGGVVATLQDIRHRLGALSKDDPARPILVALLEITERSKGDLQAFRGRIIEHFDHVMDRVGGWYRRRVARSLGIIAFVVACATNADLFHISRAVWTNASPRAALNQAADAVVAEDRPGAPGANPAGTSGPTSAERLRAALEEVPLPLGWQGETWKCDGPFLASKFLGIFITAAAMSLGAPFWFDVLRMLVSVRGKGKAP